jgi:hypothetical protein
MVHSDEHICKVIHYSAGRSYPMGNPEKKLKPLFTSGSGQKRLKVRVCGI